MPKMEFFPWIVECCALMGKPPEFGENLLPIKDPSWFFCFDEGMTPEEAVFEFSQKALNANVPPF